MNSRLSWDDLRFVLAIANAGSLSGAARALGVSHPTVFRRLSDVEARVGVSLFVRGRGGYIPTAAGEVVVEAAKRIEADVLEAERLVVGGDLAPSGVVRVTTTDTLLIGLMSEIFAHFVKEYPEISLEVAVSNELFDLGRREADVAIRPSLKPPEALIGRKVGPIHQAIYGHCDLASSSEDVRQLDWVGPDARMNYPVLRSWIAEQDVDDRCRYRVDTVLGMMAAARAGAGVAVLPCYIGDRESDLCRLSPVVESLSTDLWVLTHQDLRKTARVRAFLDFVSDQLKSCRALLSGDS